MAVSDRGSQAEGRPMTKHGRPRQVGAGMSASSRVRLTPVRKEQIDAALFAKALIAAQFHAPQPDGPSPDADAAPRNTREEQS